MKHVCQLAVVLCLTSIALSEEVVLSGDCRGVYSWASWNPKDVTRERCPHVVGAPIILKWSRVEPEEDDFRFKEQLGERLRLAEEYDFYTFLMLWAGPAAPRWIYDRGVPEVHTTPTYNPRRELRASTYPYYFDPDYRKYFFRAVERFGQYVVSLPENLRRRIVFVQSAEGSTGDGWGYKGDPLDGRYNISREDWGQFRIETWQVYKKAFTSDEELQVCLLVNDDSSRGPQHDWLMKNLDVIGCKQGMFSHGYHISDTIDRLTAWRQFVQDAEAAGKTVLCRGEQDAEWKVCGWSSRNPEQAFYWSAIFATHCGLDIWNVPHDACQGDRFALALRFFNKYARYRDPAKSPAAFVALRRGLDASDTGDFPETKFGEATKKNVDRYLKIAESQSSRGAYQGDPECATGGGMRNRQRDDYNDVGWRIWPGNYERFLKQIAPEETSVGWWHVGPTEHPYSRFARGFDHMHDRTAMSFRLHPEFFDNKATPCSVRVRVVYLDHGRGTWRLEYQCPSGLASATEIACDNTGNWKETLISIEGATFGRVPDGDLVLRYVDGDDTIFHMIELERVP